MTNYEITRQRTLDLADGEVGEDDYGAITPTPYALQTTLQLLDTLHDKLNDNCLRGYGSVEHKGGIDLTFNNLKLHIDIQVPYKKEEQYYIYIGSEPSQLVYYPTIDFLVETIKNNEN